MSVNRRSALTAALMGTGLCIIGLTCLGCKDPDPPPPPPSSKLHKVFGCDNPERKLDIVFVHGVDGDHMKTWHRAGQSENYWPRWLGEDLEEREVGVWSLDYPVATTPFRGETMNLIDRGTNVLSLLEAEGFSDAPQRPLIFVCHSFGGLVVKQVLERAEESSVEWQRILWRTNGVVFIATPNSGARLADYIDFLAKRLSEKLMGLNLTTVTVDDLKHASPHLLKLNDWYRDHWRRYGIRTLVFCEDDAIRGVTIVDKASANPGIEGVPSRPLDRDHLDICKLTTRDETFLYNLVRRFVEATFENPPPCEMPNPRGTIEAGGCPNPPSEEALEKTMPEDRSNPENVVLTYRNRTGDKLQIALYDWSRARAGWTGEWRLLEASPDGQEQDYEDFTNDTVTDESGTEVNISSGWFSVYVVKPGCRVSPCLETANLFAGRNPTIEISKQGGELQVGLTFEQ